MVNNIIFVPLRQNMFFPALDIEKKAKPIIKKINDFGVSAHLFDISKKRLKENIDDLILVIEGFSNHIQDLNKNQSEVLLQQTKKTFRSFVEIDDELNARDYLMDIEFKEKFQYSLKTLSMFKSLLHIYITQGAAVKRTPDTLKEALSRISRVSVESNIYKNSL